MNKSSSSLALDLNLPVFNVAQIEHWPANISWAEAMQHFAPARAIYMQKLDSPEQRWQDKNPEPFRLP